MGRKVSGLSLQWDKAAGLPGRYSTFTAVFARFIGNGGALVVSKIRKSHFVQFPSYYFRFKSSLFDIAFIFILFLIAIIPNSFAAQIRIAWDPNTEPDLAGFKISYGTASQSYGTLIDIGNITSHTVTGLTGGKTYYFAVRAYDSSGNMSGFSNEVSGIANEPSKTVISSDNNTSRTLSQTISNSATASNTRQRILDYDGDGKTDLAVWRAGDSKWYVKPSSGEASWTTQWGQSGDIPVPGDYDGDRETDLVVYRPRDGTWHIIPSSGGTPTMTLWGGANYEPVPGDYDGDGKTDLAVYGPGDGTCTFDILRLLLRKLCNGVTSTSMISP